VKSKSFVDSTHAAPGFYFVEPIKEQEGKKICFFKVNSGFYQGQIDEDSVSGIGAFFWNTGEFYFGEWERGAQNVRVDDLRAKASCFSRLALSSEAPSLTDS